MLNNSTLLEVFYPPGPAAIWVASPPNRLYKGERLSLSCEAAVGRPAQQTYRWHLDGRLVEEETAASWELYPVSLNTSRSNISCQAVNAVGPGASSALLTPTVNARLWFLRNLAPYTGCLAVTSASGGGGEKVLKFSCQVECLPRCHITWLRNEVPLLMVLPEPSGNISSVPLPFSVEEEEVAADPATNTFPSLLSTLSYHRWAAINGPLTNSDPEDGSNFTCEARSGEVDERAVLRSTTLFRVEYPPRELRLLSSVQSERLVVSEHAVPSPVVCAGRGQPSPRFHWTFNGHVVVRGPKLAFPSGILR